ncbi:MAG: D-glycero-alpha-D-manno-heptose-1,7-bisphosphate 7-phosphatase [Rhodothermales bacterium]
MARRRTHRRAVFLDRDGTLNREVTYLYRAEDFAWIPGAPAAVRRLNEASLLVIVVTNQAGVARGYYTEDDVRVLHAFMQDRLHQEARAHIDAFYYCPCHPEGVVEPYRQRSPDRKPGTGMFERAFREWSIDPAQSFVVGDRNTDIEPGRRLGMTTLLVETGYGAQEKAVTRADYVVENVEAAIALILTLCATTP